MSEITSKHNQIIEAFDREFMSLTKQLAKYVKQGSEIAAETIQLLEVMKAGFKSSPPGDLVLYEENLNLMRFAQREARALIQNLGKAYAHGSEPDASQEVKPLQRLATQGEPSTNPLKRYK